MKVGKIEVILTYDDVVVLGNSKKEVIQITMKLLRANKIMGLEVKKKKTYFHLHLFTSNISSY